MASINPYLTFPGNCAEAFDFYKSVFGGDFMNGGAMRYGDFPGMPQDPADAAKIMHVSLPIGGALLMGSDAHPSAGEYKPGNNFSVAISPDSEEEARRLFNALSAGGHVHMPLDRAPWNALYGGCKDKFGVAWDVNYSFDEPQN